MELQELRVDGRLLCFHGNWTDVTRKLGRRREQLDAADETPRFIHDSFKSEEAAACRRLLVLDFRLPPTPTGFTSQYQK